MAKSQVLPGQAQSSSRQSWSCRVFGKGSAHLVLHRDVEFYEADTALLSPPSWRGGEQDKTP